VTPYPLLDKYREECCRETEGESHEPNRVQTDTGWGWIESGERRWRCGRNGQLWGYEGESLGDLGQDSNILLEIVHHLVRWARLQALFAIKYERSEGSRKKTGLCIADQCDRVHRKDDKM